MVESPVELLQGGAAALLMGYLLLKVLDALPEISGPFGDAYWLFSLMPWLLFALGVVLLISMFSEVLNI